MNEAQLKARYKRLSNHLENSELLTTYEKQARKKKTDFYIDDRKRID